MSGELVEFNSHLSFLSDKVLVINPHRDLSLTPPMWEHAHALGEGLPPHLLHLGIQGPFQQHVVLLASSVQFSRSVVSDSCTWIAACQASLSITNSQNLLKLMSIESVMPSSYLILSFSLLLLLLHPLPLLSSTFPSTKVFSNESPLLLESVTTNDIFLHL